jgi:hypothetical protein
VIVKSVIISLLRNTNHLPWGKVMTSNTNRDRTLDTHIEDSANRDAGYPLKPTANRAAITKSHVLMVVRKVCSERGRGFFHLFCSSWAHHCSVGYQYPNDLSPAPSKLRKGAAQ